MDAVHQTFDRINTSISITMATYIANFLVIFMMRIQVILVGAVTFTIMTCLMVGLLRGSRIMITFRSIVGIVVVNTIMQVINDIGSSSVISDSSSVILVSTTMRGKHVCIWVQRERERERKRKTNTHIYCRFIHAHCSFHHPRDVLCTCCW